MCVAPCIVDSVSRRFVEDEADDAFVGAMEGEEVGFGCVRGAPDGDSVDEVRVCKGVIKA